MIDLFLAYLLFLSVADVFGVTAIGLRQRPLKVWRIEQLEIAAQGIAKCKVSAARVVVVAALRRFGQSRHGGHKIANISRD